MRPLKPRYCVPISIKEARDFMTVYFGTPRIPHGSKAIWVAGCKWVTDQPGVYLISGVGGMQGVVIYPPAQANAKEGAA